MIEPGQDSMDMDMSDKEPHVPYVKKVVRFDEGEFIVETFQDLLNVLPHPNYKIFCDDKRIKNEQSFLEIEFESGVPKHISLIY